jgi:hypothetical protein
MIKYSMYMATNVKINIQEDYVMIKYCMYMTTNITTYHK